MENGRLENVHSIPTPVGTAHDVDVASVDNVLFMLFSFEALPARKRERRVSALNGAPTPGEEG